MIKRQQHEKMYIEQATILQRKQLEIELPIISSMSIGVSFGSVSSRSKHPVN